jgi:hypothetical protein
VVSAKNKEDTKVNISIDVDLSVFGEVIETKEQLEIWVSDEYGHETLNEWMNDEWLEEEAKQMIKEIEKGNVLIVGRVSNESFDNPVELLLMEKGIKKILNKGSKIKVIKDATF